MTDFRVLGPVEALADGRLADAGPPQRRVVLAVLLAEAGRVVPAEALIERVWGQDPPDGARRALHVHIARLRAALAETESVQAPAPRLVHRAGGYVLDTDPQAVDLHRFRRLARQARDPACAPALQVELLGQAIALWRGQALAGLSGDWADRTRRSWRLEHMHATIAWAHAQMQTGDPATTLGPLSELAAEHPLVEPLAAALIQAQHAARHTAAALDTYATVRRRLAEELGADPGPELQELHRAILRQANPPAPVPAAVPAPGVPPGPPASAGHRHPVPAQLPADVPGFTGRGAELAELDILLHQPQHPDSPGEAPVPRTVVITAITGTAGIGKTALAVHWAHRAAGRFPDGQLYVNLRGYDPQRPVTSAEALTGFLLALGVPGSDIPLDTDARAARYRTETAGRRTLIVLDNAASVEQVRPLLPGSASCAVVVTSRDSLAGLVAVHGAHRVDLDLLPARDALALLRRLIGARVDAESPAAATLVERCARLPLALRVAAELAATRPAATLAELVGELAGRQQRLDLLDAGGDPRAAVRAVFSWSLQHLPSDAARLFGLLGLHPAPDFDTYAAAALAGTGLDAARRVLGVLARAHLIQPVRGGRYGMHDLLRAYAVGLAAAEDAAGDPAKQSRAALDRLFDYYLAAAAAAMNRLHPDEAHRRPATVPPVTSVPDLPDPGSALAWLNTERTTLVSVAAHTADHGWPAHTVRLSATLFRYLAGGHYTDALTIHRHARNAADQTGDLAGQARALTNLATAYGQVGRHEHAAGHFRQALTLSRQAGDLVGQARALGNLGLVERRLGRYEPAAGHYEQALALFQQAGDRTGEAFTLTGLGLVEQRLGRHGPAIGHHRQALTLYRQIGHGDGEAHVLTNLGDIERRLGRYEQAASHLQQALDLTRRLGNRTGEADVLTTLGEVHTRLGPPEQAAEHLHQALTLFRESGDRHGEARVLNGLGEAAHAAGNPADALTHHAAAHAAASDTGDRDQQARAHAGIALAHYTLGDTERARHHYQHALTLYTDLGSPEADDIHDRVAALDPDPPQAPIPVDHPTAT